MSQTIRFRFGLRTALVVILVVSVPLAAVGIRFQKHRRERALAARVAEAGGSVESRPAWLGIFATPYLVDLSRLPGEPVWPHPGSDDAELLNRLPQFESLEILILAGTAIEDRHLSLLAGCSRLASLDLTATRVTDEGLPHLARILTLVELDLTQTEVSDQGAAKLLESLPRLAIVDD